MSRLIKSSQIIVGETFTLEQRKPMIVHHDRDNRSTEPVDWEQRLREQIRAEAQQEADEWLSQRKQQWEEQQAEWEQELAKQYEDRLQAGYEQGLQQGYDDGYQRGKDEGYQQSKEEASHIAEELSRVLKNVEQRKDTLIENYIIEMKDLALDIAGKIVREKISDEQSIYLRMIHEGLDSFREYQWVDIYVSEEEVGLDLYLYSRLADEFANQSKVLKVRSKGDLPQGSCIIETDGGVVDIGIDTQLTSLAEELDFVPRDVESKL